MQKVFFATIKTGKNLRWETVETVGREEDLGLPPD